MQVTRTALLRKLTGLECVVLMAGTNNIIKTNWRQPAAHMADGVLAILEQLLHQNPQLRIAVFAIPPGRVFEDSEELRVQFNQALKEMVARLGVAVQFYDFSDVFMEGNAYNKRLFQDAVHFNARGYEQFGRVIGQVLEELLSTP